MVSDVVVALCVSDNEQRGCGWRDEDEEMEIWGTVMRVQGEESRRDV